MRSRLRLMLLGNAWKFTARQPSVRVELVREDANGATAYHVRDNGAGFSLATLQRIVRLTLPPGARPLPEPAPCRHDPAGRRQP